MKSSASLRVRPGEVIAAFGKRGAGKTVFLKEAGWYSPATLIFDTMDEFRGFRKFTSISSLFEFIKNEESFHVRYVPPPDSDVTDDARDIARLVLARGNMLLIIDEADRVFPNKLGLPSEVQSLITRGRHADIALIFASQRPSLVSRLATSQASRFVFFKLVEPKDIAYCREFVSIDAGAVRGLPKGWHYSVNV